MYHPTVTRYLVPGLLYLCWTPFYIYLEDETIFIFIVPSRSIVTNYRSYLLNLYFFCNYYLLYFCVSTLQNLLVQ